MDDTTSHNLNENIDTSKAVISEGVIEKETNQQELGSPKSTILQNMKNFSKSIGKDKSKISEHMKLISIKKKNIEFEKKELDEKEKELEEKYELLKRDQNLLQLKESQVFKKMGSIKTGFSKLRIALNDFVKNQEPDPEDIKMQEEMEKLDKELEVMTEERSLLKAAKEKLINAQNDIDESKKDITTNSLENDRKILTEKQEKYNQEKKEFENEKASFEKRFESYLAEKEELSIKEQRIKEDKKDAIILKDVLIQKQNDIQSKSSHFISIQNKFKKEKEEVDLLWSQLKEQINVHKESRKDFENDKNAFQMNKDEFLSKKTRFETELLHYHNVESEVDKLSKQLFFDEIRKKKVFMITSDTLTEESIQDFISNQLFDLNNEMQSLIDQNTLIDEKHRREIYQLQHDLSIRQNRISELDQQILSFHHDNIVFENEIQRSEVKISLLKHDLSNLHEDYQNRLLSLNALQQQYSFYNNMNANDDNVKISLYDEVSSIDNAIKTRIQSQNKFHTQQHLDAIIRDIKKQNTDIYNQFIMEKRKDYDMLLQNMKRSIILETKTRLKQLKNEMKLKLQIEKEKAYNFIINYDCMKNTT